MNEAAIPVTMPVTPVPELLLSFREERRNSTAPIADVPRQAAEQAARELRQILSAEKPAKIQPPATKQERTEQEKAFQVSPSVVQERSRSRGGQAGSPRRVPPPSPSTPAKSSRKAAAVATPSFTPLDDSAIKATSTPKREAKQPRRSTRAPLGNLTSKGSSRNTTCMYAQKSPAAATKASSYSSHGGGHSSPGGSYADLRRTGSGGRRGANSLHLAMFRAKHGGPSVGSARTRMSLARTGNPAAALSSLPRSPLQR